MKSQKNTKIVAKGPGGRRLALTWFLAIIFGLFRFPWLVNFPVAFRNILTMLDRGPNLVRIFLTWPQSGRNMALSFSAVSPLTRSLRTRLGPGKDHVMTRRVPGYDQIQYKTRIWEIA